MAWRVSWDDNVADESRFSGFSIILDPTIHVLAENVIGLSCCFQELNDTLMRQEKKQNKEDQLAHCQKRMESKTEEARKVSIQAHVERSQSPYTHPL